MEPFGSERGWVSPGWPFFLGLGLSVLLSVGFFSGRFSRSSQPIAFNHARHIENGMACTDCHAGVQNDARATLPTLATCLSCHETALTQSKEEEKIRALAAAGSPVLWTQLTRMPSHVYFSHRRHVLIAGLDCATCHGPMEKTSAPPPRPFRQISMSTCISCHEKSHTRTDCNDCHR